MAYGSWYIVLVFDFWFLIQFLVLNLGLNLDVGFSTPSKNCLSEFCLAGQLRFCFDSVSGSNFSFFFQDRT